MEIIGGLALAAVLFVAGLRVAGGAMTLGDLLGIVTAIGVATPAARSLKLQHRAQRSDRGADAHFRPDGRTRQRHRCAGAKPLAAREAHQL